jgi:hypothetical protein
MQARGETPNCPLHPGSRVWRDGIYGEGDRRRQRYRCIPADGSAPHRFSEPVVRKGARALRPRLFSYNAEEIAAALVAVGKGMSYRSAARLVPRSPAPDGNSVADWVELFAPPIYARHAERRWPDTVALDELRFHARSRDARGRALPEEVPAFRILAALAYGRGAAAEVVALRAVPGYSPRGAQPFWEELLRAFEGTPAELVCAPDPNILRAIDAVWHGSDGDAPVVLLSHSHLQRELLELLGAEGVSPDDKLFATAARAFESAAAWRAFARMPTGRRLRALEGWLRRYGDRVAWQLERQGGRVTDTTELERRLAPLRAQLAGRRGTLANRRRTNRLLMLTQLEMNRRADVTAYAEILEAEVRAQDGRAGQRRQIVDRAGSSLRP